MHPPIRFGILGTAKIARTVAPMIAAASDAQLVAIASRSREKARAFAMEFSIPHAFASYEELLASDQIDAVYVPLPPSMHCEWVVRLAAAGKHILCEKPLAMDVDEVDRMQAACKHHHVVLLDGVMWYHTARARRIREIVQSGGLGAPRQITSAFTFPGDRMAKDNLRWNRAMGGGSLLDLGWYCVGATLWLTDALPRQVFATADFRYDVDQRLNGLMWFDDGCMASFECGFTAVRRRWLEVAGTTAALNCDDFTRPWTPEEPAIRITDGDGRVTRQIIAHPPQEICMVQEFCRLIRDQQTEHSWRKLSRDTQHVCDLLSKSARTGQVLPVDGC